VRIAILARSTQPRGGVVHALSLGEALCDLGHEAVVHAPDPTGRGFFREARCPVVSVAAKPARHATVPAADAQNPSAQTSAAAALRAGVAAHLAHFSTPAACDFDVFHAHCTVGGNALATLTHRRLIPGFVRTVHRVDDDLDPDLDPWRERGVVAAARVLCASRAGAAALAAEHGIRAEAVGGGVDAAAYAPEPGPGDAGLRRRLGLGGGPVLLALGGLDPRRNALATIGAFARLRAERPSAQLVLAGEAPGFSGYAARCRAALEREGLGMGPGGPVVRAGAVAQADMPGLYRLADALVSPSLADGYGLCALEALACGTPAIVSARAPFTEYLRPGDALLVDPEDPEALAAAMRASLEPGTRARLSAAGRAVARAHGWDACARRHLPAYAALAKDRGAGEGEGDGTNGAAPPATGSAAWNTTRWPGRA
jgi:glycosyltransferase-like protein